MSDLIERLRKMAATHERGFPVTILYSEISQALDIEAADRLASLEKENAELRAERDLLQDILDGRPAINAGLPETYIRWSQSVYSGDAVRAIFSRIKPSEAEGREG